jgi:hypothetical protein
MIRYVLYRQLQKVKSPEMMSFGAFFMPILKSNVPIDQQIQAQEAIKIIANRPTQSMRI